tara:strand:+ start:72 stop:236 length:165 start_codon:yes stop_codon:yes gene_type:complete
MNEIGKRLVSEQGTLTQSQQAESSLSRDGNNEYTTTEENDGNRTMSMNELLEMN